MGFLGTQPIRRDCGSEESKIQNLNANILFHIKSGNPAITATVIAAVNAVKCQ